MRTPKHIAIIPDGNRRWAISNGMNKQDGYEYGISPGIEVIKKAREYNIKELTFYGFTMDNCKRPKEQQKKFKEACINAIKEIEQLDNVKILVIGNSNSICFPEELKQYTSEITIGNPDIKINFLINYDWKWDLEHGLNNLHSKYISRIDLIIRWGNMCRLSGLLPIQSVYSDIFVVKKLWPDYNNDDFEAALTWYDKQDVTLGG